MTQQKYRLDMDMMIAVHDALRRDLVQVTRIAKISDGSPGRQLHAVEGWQIFKKFLDVHTTAEDDTLWPALRAHAVDQPDQLAILDAMGAEHASLDPLLASVEAAAADPDHGYQRLGDCVDELVTAVTGHLTHEEGDGLDLMDALLTPEELLQFTHLHRTLIGDDRIRFMPWLLEEASENTATHIMGAFPEPLLNAYRAKWGPDWAAANRWEANGKPKS
jgi:Hemerythrin HHE cation binding domain